jgi:hypothetical protein
MLEGWHSVVCIFEVLVYIHTFDVCSSSVSNQEECCQDDSVAFG